MRISLLLVVLIVSVVTGCVRSASPLDEQRSSGDASVQEEQVDLDGQYREAVSRIMQPYWQDGDSAGVKDAILEQRVPASLFDFHFSLVLALERLEEAIKDDDSEAATAARDRLIELRVNQPWIDASGNN